MTIMKLAITGLLLAASLSSVSQAKAAEEKTKLSVSATEVVPGLYMLQGVGGFVGGNMGLSVGADGVILIDDSLAPNLDIVKAGIKTVTDKPIDYLINTHVHGDHIGNNESLGKQGAQIVAHDNLRIRQFKEAAAKNTSPAKSALPVITFSHSMHFYLNGNDAHIFHVEHAHTDGDAVIHFKQANVIHAGDVMFNSLFPYIDLSRGGSVDGYIAAQKKILSLTDNKTKIIPGHGPLASKQDLAEAVAMLEDSKKLISDLIAKGKSEDEAVKLNPLAKYHDQWNWGFITTEKMIRQVYKGIKQQ